MAKKNPDTEAQWGRQTPDGKTIWRSEVIARKIGWTTAEGRAEEQVAFDNQISMLGVTTGDSTKLKFYTRTQYIAYTEPVLVVDGTLEETEAAPEVDSLDQLQAYINAATTPATLVPVDPPAVQVTGDTDVPADALQITAAPSNVVSQVPDNIVADPSTLVLDTHVDAAIASTDAPAPVAAAPVINVVNNLGPVPPASHEPIPPQNPGAWPPATTA